MFPSGVKPFYILSDMSYSLSASLPMAAFLHKECFPECSNETPEAGGIYPNSQCISEATNKRASGSYPNDGGSIVRVWRAASFSASGIVWKVAIAAMIMPMGGEL